MTAHGTSFCSPRPRPSSRSGWARRSRTGSRATRPTACFSSSPAARSSGTTRRVTSTGGGRRRSHRRSPMYSLRSRVTWTHARRTHEQLSVSDPRFRDAVADLAAALHDRPKDELIGEEVRQHRRTVRIVRGAVALLSALVLVATVAVVALRERNTAREQRDRAEREARIATSRGVAGQALLQLRIARLRPAPGARGVQAQSDGRRSTSINRGDAAKSGNVRNPASSGGRIKGGRQLVEPTGERLAARADAKILLWSVARRRPVGVLEQRSLGTIAFSADGGLLAVPDHNAIRLWDLSAARATPTLLGAMDDTVLALTFSRDGALLAPGGRDGTVLVWDAARRTRLRPPLLPPGTDVPDVRSAVLSTAFAADQAVAGRWTRGRNDQRLEHVHVESRTAVANRRRCCLQGLVLARRREARRDDPGWKSMALGLSDAATRQSTGQGCRRSQCCVQLARREARGQGGQRGRPSAVRPVDSRAARHAAPRRRPCALCAQLQPDGGEARVRGPAGNDRSLGRTPRQDVSSSGPRRPRTLCSLRSAAPDRGGGRRHDDHALGSRHERRQTSSRPKGGGTRCRLQPERESAGCGRA